MLRRDHMHGRLWTRRIAEYAIEHQHRRAVEPDRAVLSLPAADLAVLYRHGRDGVREFQEPMRTQRGAAPHRAAVLWHRDDIGRLAPFEVAVAGVEVAMHALDADAAAAELAPVVRPVIVIEAGGLGARAAVFEQAVYCDCGISCEDLTLRRRSASKIEKPSW